MSCIRRLALAIAMFAFGSGYALAATYSFSGTLNNGDVVTGTITGGPNNITAFTFFLPASMPNTPNDEMDQTNTFYGFIGPTYFQFEQIDGSFTDILNLDFTGLPGSLITTNIKSQLVQEDANSEPYFAFFVSGAAVTPLPSTFSLLALGLCVIGLVGWLRPRFTATAAGAWGGFQQA